VPDRARRAVRDLRQRAAAGGEATEAAGPWSRQRAVGAVEVIERGGRGKTDRVDAEVRLGAAAIAIVDTQAGGVITGGGLDMGRGWPARASAIAECPSVGERIPIGIAR